MDKKKKILLICSIVFIVLAVALLLFDRLYLVPKIKENNDKIESSKQDSSKKEFYFYDSDGEKYSFDSFNSTPIALILWSSNTDNSYEILEMLENVYEEYKSSVTFLVVNTNEPDDDIINLVTECNYSFPVYYDKDNLASECFSYSRLPALLFYESNGELSNTVEKTITEDSLLANLDIISGNY